MSSNAPPAASRRKPNSSLDRSSSMALAFFNRRHSSTQVRRSASSISSRRHSSPIHSDDKASDSASASASGEDHKRIPRSLRWRLLASKVLGNVDEEHENGNFLRGEKQRKFYSQAIDARKLYRRSYRTAVEL